MKKLWEQGMNVVTICYVKNMTLLIAGCAWSHLRNVLISNHSGFAQVDAYRFDNVDVFTRPRWRA